GAVILLKALDTPVVVSRTPPRGRPPQAMTVLTPDVGTVSADLTPFLAYPRLLIVLPKWLTRQQPLHPGYVDKVTAFQSGAGATAFLKALAPRTDVWLRRGESNPMIS